MKTSDHHYDHFSRDVICPSCWKCFEVASQQEKDNVAVLVRMAYPRHIVWVSRQLVRDINELTL